MGGFLRRRANSEPMPPDGYPDLPTERLPALSLQRPRTRSRRTLRPLRRGGRLPSTVSNASWTSTPPPRTATGTAPSSWRLRPGRTASWPPPNGTSGASALTLSAGRLPVAEQLELLFEVPPAAPGQPAADPVPRPKTGESGRFGPISADRREKTAHDGAVTAPQGTLGPPPFRRCARWSASRSATSMTAGTTSEVAASTRRP